MGKGRQRRDVSTEYKKEKVKEEMQLENSKTAHRINDLNAGGSRGGRPVKPKPEK